MNVAHARGRKCLILAVLSAAISYCGKPANDSVTSAAVTAGFGRDAAPLALTANASRKKGIGTWQTAITNGALADLNAPWFYTWSPNLAGVKPPAGAEFVPMIWGEKNVNDWDLNEAKKHGDVLLGFNEPDHPPFQGSSVEMSVEHALELWPRLQATGMKLCSPAPADHTFSNPHGWLPRFMQGAKRKGYRVDYLCLHWYGSSFDVDGSVWELKDMLQRAHNQFHLPIWLTEYSLIGWDNGGVRFPSSAVQADFAKKSAAMLETLPFVERYAWFSLTPYTSNWDESSNLYDYSGNITEVGRAYRAAGGSAPTPPPPAPAPKPQPPAPLPPAPPPSRPLKIMAVGDSITEFVKDISRCPMGYRYEFWKQLVDSGLNFTMVGSHSYAQDYGATYPTYRGQTFQDRNNAWGGWTTSDILNGVGGNRWGAGRGNLEAWLYADTPDVVLLHIGTNDSWSGQTADAVEANIRRMIAIMQAHNPEVVIYLAKIIPFGSALAHSAGALVPAYNGRMDAIASTMSTGRSKIRVVDQYSGYDADRDNACDTQYQVHPGVEGARKIGGKFLAAILADFPLAAHGRP